MKTNCFLFCIAVLTFTSCVQENEKELVVVSETEIKRFVQPPFPNADVPFSKFAVDAFKGDTVFHESGSILIFPSNSFVDENGNVIEGEVDIKYREFSNPMDFYLSGIPLEYDSAGVSYDFESSGMCEVLAFQDENPVFVNPNSNPQINLASKNSSNKHGIYFLDTVKRNWEFKEMSTATVLNSPIQEDVKNLVKPLKPEKANNKSPIIEIEIDPNSFEELMIFNNLKFQLDHNETAFNPSDANELWHKVELVKRNKNGLYTVNFKNINKSVSYSARPVLEGDDYEKALLVFERKNAEYKRKLKNRVERGRLAKEEYDRILRLNTLVEARNKAFEKENRKLEMRNIATNKEIEEENKRLSDLNDEKIKEINELIESRIAANDEIRRDIEKQIQLNEEQQIQYQERLAQRVEDNELTDEVMRSFNIQSFGTWNCDRPFGRNPQWIVAKFIDVNGDHLELTNVAVAARQLNGLRRFPKTKIQIAQGLENMIFAVNDGKLAYLSFKEFAKLDVDPNAVKHTFTMQIIPKENITYEYLQGLQ
ncbi:hypothetical protein [Brumimicrobium mesophilum]|uniref:hypothetical protein n=1 Tax=Brumimicrobium mesophilum TaxID=392717 RepID=UPI000D13FF19|nr:hypothetical protein [Brumimicrobium mesophilum]